MHNSRGEGGRGEGEGHIIVFANKIHRDALKSLTESLCIGLQRS